MTHRVVAATPSDTTGPFHMGDYVGHDGCFVGTVIEVDGGRASILESSAGGIRWWAADQLQHFTLWVKVTP